MACRRCVEPVITSRQNVFRFLNGVTCGHCSNSGLSICFLLGVESLSRDLPSETCACHGFLLSKKSITSWSSSGKMILPHLAKGFPLREDAEVLLKVLPMLLAQSHHCETVLICPSLALQGNPDRFLFGTETRVL